MIKKTSLSSIKALSGVLAPLLLIVEEVVMGTTEVKITIEIIANKILMVLIQAQGPVKSGVAALHQIYARLGKITIHALSSFVST